MTEKQEVKITKEQSKKLEEMLEQMKMPIVLDDKEFAMGEKEIDIRKLSARNREQMFFRQNMLTNVYLRDIAVSLVDTQRLLMLVLTKMGVKDIGKELNELLEKLIKKGE